MKPTITGDARVTHLLPNFEIVQHFEVSHVIVLLKRGNTTINILGDHIDVEYPGASGIEIKKCPGDNALLDAMEFVVEIERTKV